MAGCDVLIFVEDPGAANFLADLPVALAGRKVQTILFTSGAATEYLAALGVSSKILGSEQVAEAMAEINPQAVLVGTSENPDTPALSLIDAAVDGEIPSIGVVDASTNSAHRFRGRTKDALAHCPDWLLLSDLATAESYASLGMDRQRMFVCGHPHADYVYREGRRILSEPKSVRRERIFPGVERTIVLFAAELSTGLDPAQYQRQPNYSLQGRSESDNRTDIVLEELIDAIAPWRKKIHFVLRLHPKNSEEDLKSYRAFFDQISQREPSLEVLTAVDLVIGLSSMLLAEAALLEVPALAILPRDLEKNWLPTLAAGTTLSVMTREALDRTLRLFFEEGPQTLSGTTPVTSVFPPGATDRAADFISRIIQRVRT